MNLEKIDSFKPISVKDNGHVGLKIGLLKAKFQTILDTPNQHDQNICCLLFCLFWEHIGINLVLYCDNSGVVMYVI